MRFKVSKKIYLHIDCDSFFAYCEILKNPNLKWKIVCVWHELILASSYEAKRLWINTWMPIWEAKKITKGNWYFFKPDMLFYSEVSMKFIQYLIDNTFNVEQFSIDEAFCEISWLPEYNKISLDDYLLKLQKDILINVWVSVSIGCSNTKIKAKIYSKLNKPYWIFNWFNIDEIENFKNLKLQIIPFIWKKTQEKLKYKASTVYDFLRLWFWKLDELIGKTSTDLRLELNWVDSYKNKKSLEIKSFSRSRSFNSNINSNIDFLDNELLKNFEYVFRELFIKNLLVKHVSILLRDKDFNIYYSNYILPDYTNNREILLKIIKELFVNIYNDCLQYRSTWITFSDFKSFLPRQMSVFDFQNMSTLNNFSLNKTIIDLNIKYWDNKVTYWFNNIYANKLKTRFIT